MPPRVVTVLKEWKEIIVLLAAISGLYVATPKSEQPQRENPATAAALERLTHAVDSLNIRVQALSTQIDALVRMQCAQPDKQRTLALAGVACHNNGD